MVLYFLYMFLLIERFCQCLEPKYTNGRTLFLMLVLFA